VEAILIRYFAASTAVEQPIGRQFSSQNSFKTLRIDRSDTALVISDFHHEYDIAPLDGEVLCREFSTETENGTSM
jgi:hypothetical protein